jgi:hypothetical protein
MNLIAEESAPAGWVCDIRDEMSRIAQTWRRLPWNY